jgi:hypothetical protein
MVIKTVYFISTHSGTLMWYMDDVYVADVHIGQRTPVVWHGLHAVRLCNAGPDQHALARLLDGIMAERRNGTYIIGPNAETGMATGQRCLELVPSEGEWPDVWSEIAFASQERLSSDATARLEEFKRKISYQP